MNPKFFSLKEIAEVTSGGGAPQSDNDFGKEGTPFIRAGSLTKLLHGQSEHEQEKISEEVAKKHKLKKYNKNTILFAKSGMSATKGHIYLTVGECYVVNHLAALVCNEKANPAYVAYALKKYSPTTLILDPAYPSIRLSDIANLKIPLPPLSEQQRIVDLLDAADSILRLRELAIAKLDEITQSVFLDMFGDPCSPKFKFKTFKIGQLISEMRGGASLKPEDFVESGFPILHKGAIKKHGLIEIDLRKKTFATVQYANRKKSSIVTKDFMAVTLRDLVPTGPSIGLIVNLNDGNYEEYLLAQGAYGFKIDSSRVTPEYLIALSNMPSFRSILKKFSVGSTQIHMRCPVFTSLVINLPDIDLQNKFSEVIKNIWKLRNIENSFLEKEKILFNSLQHQSFTIN